MIDYRIGIIGALLIFASIPAMYGYFTSQQNDDCTHYLTSNSLTSDEFKQLAYEECLDTPLYERDNAKNVAIIILGIALAPMGIHVLYLSLKDRKKQIKDRSIR